MRRGCKNSIILIFTNVCFRESSIFPSELIKLFKPAARPGYPTQLQQSLQLFKILIHHCVDYEQCVWW